MDNGLEFCNKDLDNLCALFGIKRHKTVPYTPQQNGVAESRLAPVYGWGGAEQQRVELESDGVTVRPDMTVDLANYQWWPDLA